MILGSQNSPGSHPVDPRSKQNSNSYAATTFPALYIEWRLLAYPALIISHCATVGISTLNLRPLSEIPEAVRGMTGAFPTLCRNSSSISQCMQSKDFDISIVDQGITYDGKKRLRLTLWSDAEEGRESVLGLALMIDGGAVSWSLKKQSSVAFHGMESESIAILHVLKEQIWLHTLLKELDRDVSNQNTTAGALLLLL